MNQNCLDCDLRMTKSTSGHTEFDDLVILAQSSLKDVVLKRTFQRLQDRLTHCENALEKKDRLLHDARLLARDIIASGLQEPDAGDFVCDFYDKSSKHFGLEIETIEVLQKKRRQSKK